MVTIRLVAKQWMQQMVIPFEILKESYDTAGLAKFEGFRSECATIFTCKFAESDRNNSRWLGQDKLVVPCCE
jgi:hypothetical protein